MRTFADHTRNTLDLSAIPYVKRCSHLPIIADPSHGTGRREKVTPLSCAAVATGAHGLIIEVHNHPDQALSDGAQSLYPEQFTELMGRVADHAVQIHGGYGLMKDYNVERFYRDHKLLEIGEGTSEIQRLVISRYIGC